MSLSEFVSRSCRDGIEDVASAEGGLCVVPMLSPPYRARECKKKQAGTCVANPRLGIFISQLVSWTIEHPELGKCILLNFRVLINSRAFREKPNSCGWPFSFRK